MGPPDGRSFDLLRYFDFIFQKKDPPRFFVELRSKHCIFTEILEIVFLCEFDCDILVVNALVLVER